MDTFLLGLGLVTVIAIGTLLGDAIKIAALTAFATRQRDKQIGKLQEFMAQMPLNEDGSEAPSEIS